MKNNIEYGFLGGVFEPIKINEIKEKSIGNIQFASNALQWNLISGLENKLKRSVKIFSRMFIGSYPQRYKDYYIKSSKFSHKKDVEDINLGFINIYFIKQLILPYVPNKALENWIVSNDKKKVLFVYSANFTKSIMHIKRLFPSVHICLILPDFPDFMDLDKSNNILYRLKNKHNHNQLLKSTKLIDSFVLLTDQMADGIGIRDIKPYVVIEGMVSDFHTQNNSNQGHDKTKTICYTGTLTKKYGIMDLVKAFQLIDDNEYKLIICGSGEAEPDIRKIALEDSRIEYKGIVSREDAMRIQMTSSVLVNPRKNDGAYTKYSFPSKIMEYMVAGRPIICYKLDGIPDEYDNYLNYVTDNSVESLKNKLIEVLSLDPEQLTNQGVINRRFVIENKNNIIQAQKIIEMVNAVLKDQENQTCGRH